MSNQTNLQYNQLTDEEIDHPVDFIKAFCACEFELNQFRAEITDMIKSACAYEKFGDRENYFFNYRCLLKFLEAGHIIYEQELSYSLTSDNSDINLQSERLSDYYDQLIKTDFRTLSAAERDDTNVFFNDFFGFQTLNQWRLTFSRFVEYAYRYNTIDEVIEDGSIMVIFREYTEKLVETVYLIYHAQTMDFNHLFNSQSES